MADPDLISRRMLRGLTDRDNPDSAADAASEVGWIVSETRGLHARVNLLIALVLLVIGVLFQIAFRLASIAPPPSQ